MIGAGGGADHDYATGNVVSTGGNAGGFVGNASGPIDSSYATGRVTGPGATGGFVGSNGGCCITNAYATGAVIGTGFATGGFVGSNGGSIATSYSTGWVTGPSLVGGFAGNNGLVYSQLTNDYWDTTTSGTTVGSGRYYYDYENHVSGLTTAQLQGALPGGFDSSIWATGSGLYPYLKTFFPNGAQAITGFTDTASLAASPGAAVTAYLNGGQLGSTVYSGANGYYYDLVPANTIGSTTPFGLAMTLAGQGSVSAIAFIDTPVTTGTVINNGNFQAGRFFGRTLRPTWSAMLTEMSSTFGASRFASLETTAPFGHTDIYAFGPTFTLDVAQDTTNVLKITENIGGTLVTTAPITVEQGGTVQFISNGALAINAPITLKGGGLVDMRYDYSLVQHGGTADPSAFSFGSGGSISFLTASGAAATSSQGGNLSINDAVYTMIFSMAQLDALDGINGVTGASTTPYGTGLGGHYALANDLAASGTTYQHALVNNFYGTFEGLGHAINNLTFNYTASSADDVIGLFGGQSGVIRDVNLANLAMAVNDPSGAHPNAGGLVAYDSGSLYNVSVSGDINASGAQTSNVGGTIGYGAHDTIVNANASDTVEGGTGDNIGGLMGLGYQVSIAGSSATGNVTASGSAIGGLVGYLEVFSSISKSYATGTVNAGTSSLAGGLVGYSYGTIDQSYAKGNVISEGGSTMGGLVGANYVDTGSGSPSFISNSYATGNVEEGSTVVSTVEIGGLVGNNLSQISNSYSTGLVLPSVSTANVYVGGLVGYNMGSVTNSYWDTQASGQTTSAGGTGETTAQLQSGTLPAGFAPAIWTASGGHYAKLKAVSGQ